MKHKPLSHLEARLEHLVEGTFSHIFRRRLTTHDLAIKIARALESQLRIPGEDDPRPIAPDDFTVHVHPATLQNLLHSKIDLAKQLSGYLTELASQSGYRLLSPPVMKLIADDRLASTDLVITANHTNDVLRSTAAMQPIRVTNKTTTSEPHLIIDGITTIPLERHTIDIGRAETNDIVLEDLYISRHHVQLRRRHGTYILFDVQSRGGTFVNDVPVREHHLRSGDVIRIGHTQIVYWQEDKEHPSTVDGTAPMSPVEE